jgi:hypothetical protein
VTEFTPYSVPKVKTIPVYLISISTMVGITVTMDAAMYQLEVKQWLVHYRFPPRAGWRVHVDVDEMERGEKGQQALGKSERARIAEAALRALSVTVGAHPVFGRTDVVAEHPDHGLVLIEAEGRSQRQKQDALYSALGQLLIQMSGDTAHRFVVALPDDEKWLAQAQKITAHTRSRLDLSIVLVSPHGVRDV